MNVFIDLGAYRGLYINRFRKSSMYKPGAKIYAFECNSFLRNFQYGSDVTVIHKAAWVCDGELKFYLSKRNPSLVQGSSVYREKRTGNLDKEHPQKIPCIDFSKWIKNTFQPDDNIIVKMNIEGAEYDILEKMIADDTLKYIKKLFVQFHWERCGVPIDRHNKLILQLKKSGIEMFNGYGHFK